MVHSPDPFKDTLKRPHSPPQLHVTMAACPPPPLSYTLAAGNPLLPSNTHSTFEAKFKGTLPITEWWLNKMGSRAICWWIGSLTRHGKGWVGFLEGSQQATGSFGLANQQATLFEWDDLSEEALQNTDKCLRQRWNANKDMSKEIMRTSHISQSKKARTNNPPIPSKLDSTSKSLIRGNGKGKGGEKGRDNY